MTVPERASVVIAGAGMVGLTLATDLRQRGVDVVLLEKSERLSEGSRSICQAKRTLEIWDRLGAGERMRELGVTWNVGRVFHRDRELYAFNLLPEDGHKMPAFVNLQQFMVEDVLHTRLRALGGEPRFRHRLTAVAPDNDGVTVTVEAPDGNYEIRTDWLISCEGVRSTVRNQLGLKFEGDIFDDKFLIADVRFKNHVYPNERWFWFEPEFHPGQTALRHPQANDVWRIDLQLGPDADAEEERKPENVRKRIKKMLGHDDFELVWVSVYVFQCRTLERYVHDRIIFAGDSAHQVSPFGARGGNGGIQDADNLAWKLARVLKGASPVSLLETYDSERGFAAKENILNSRRATEFMSPKTKSSRVMRDEVLALAAKAPFARSLVNSGRLSVPAHLSQSTLNSSDTDAWQTGVFAPGSPAMDAPVRWQDGREGFLLEGLGGDFVAFTLSETVPEILSLAGEKVRVLALGRDFLDVRGLVAKRYDLQPGSTLLFRPDQHLALRRRTFNAGDLESAIATATQQKGAA